MKQIILRNKTKRLIGLLAFIATGGGLIISTAIHERDLYKTEILVIIGCFFAISLVDHFKKLKEREDEKNETK